MGYRPWRSERVGHDLAPKQQQQPQAIHNHRLLFFLFLGHTDLGHLLVCERKELSVFLKHSYVASIKKQPNQCPD